MCKASPRYEFFKTGPHALIARNSVFFVCQKTISKASLPHLSDFCVSFTEEKLKIFNDLKQIKNASLSSSQALTDNHDKLNKALVPLLANEETLNTHLRDYNITIHKLNEAHDAIDKQANLLHEQIKVLSQPAALSILVICFSCLLQSIGLDN